MSDESCALRAPFALKAEGLCKSYRQGEATIEVLKSVGLDILRGEKVAIVGRSGSGKSTLLHVLAGLDSADAGHVWVDGVDLVSADNDSRANVRAQSMGFVYQNHHLLAEFTALENVAMPLRIAGEGVADSTALAYQLLQEVGLSDRVEHLPEALSGGERQRVAVARAVAGDPSIVLADEPTGNLDRENADQVLEMISNLAAQHDTGFLVVTHDESMLNDFSRTLRLENGSLVHD
jgi:lipoprotein-releasing system ATP-binding protein